ncbi:MAG TPA: DUF1684 domain-containing protein [Candidatus Acidoferrales bacterium]
MKRTKQVRVALLALAALAFLVASATLVAGDAETAYKSSVERWRAQREAHLKADDGWLSVAGLFWLHNGQNKFGSAASNDIVLPSSAPAQVGTFEFHDGTTTVHVDRGLPVMVAGKRVETAMLRPDSDPAFDDKTDQITLDDLTLYVHASGSRYAVRLLHKNSRLRKVFTGLRWFPVDQSYRVVARYVPYGKPRTVIVENIMGDFTPTEIPGYVSFQLHGQPVRLDVESNAPNPGLSITFRDATSGKETYGAARFLVTDEPKDGKVVLDFNEAYNPPCAYNPYTTCPLPTPQNRLKVRIAAGEMTYLGPR